METYLPCLYAFLGCAGFCFIFEVKKPVFILVGSAIGAMSWAVYLLTAGTQSEIARYLAATVAVSFLAEVFARVLKAPATLFLIIGIIPLVPGGGLYYTMDALINGDTALFVTRGMATASCAGSIAVGVSMVTSLARLLSGSKAPRH